MTSAPTAPPPYQPASPPPIPVRLPPDLSADGILRAAAQLAARSILVGGIAAACCFLLGLAVPLLFFIGPLWLMLPSAAAAGGVGAAAVLVVVRVLRQGRIVESLVVPAGGFLLAIPALVAFSGFAGAAAPLGVWLWFPIAFIAPLIAHRRELARPREHWRPVMVRLLVATGVAIGTFALVLLTGADSSSLPLVGGWTGRSAAFVLFAFAGAVGLAGLLVSIGPFRTPGRATAVWVCGYLLSASLAVAMVVTSRPAFEQVPPVAEPLPSLVPQGEPPAGDEPPVASAPAELPSLDEARGQFAALLDTARVAAGPSATWSEATPLAIVETPCAGGTSLSLSGEFTTGVITDTTSDEHDREVTEGNVAAADRIAAAWHAAGLGSVERLHDEPMLGGGALGAVESARIDFEFGIVLPRVDGTCVPVP